MQIYEVGGVVRDRLLGLPAQDKDYVVVGATEEEMKILGYQPVGRDFPVFLHPVTHEAYALARTEKKTATGYHGFVFHADPHVTLEEDLARRDLTINAMAQDVQGNIIDPFGGQIDLKNKCLRHISLAFLEDPVRILRTARFAARFNFIVHPDTLKLMHHMVLSGEIYSLVPERVWQEFAKGLMETSPSILLKTLHQCGALAVLLPEIMDKQSQLEAVSAADEINIYRLLALDYAAQQHMSLAVRFSLLVYPFDRLGNFLPQLKNVEQRDIADRFKIPKACKNLALISADYCHRVEKLMTCETAELLQLFQRGGAFHCPNQFGELLAVFQCVLYSLSIKEGNDAGDCLSITFLHTLLSAAKKVNITHLAKTCDDTATLVETIAKKRMEAIDGARARF